MEENWGKKMLEKDLEVEKESWLTDWLTDCLIVESMTLETVIKKFSAATSLR